MISRRTFLAGASTLAPAAAKRSMAVAMGLEIYSLRREAEKDLPGNASMDTSAC